MNIQRPHRRPAIVVAAAGLFVIALTSGCSETKETQTAPARAATGGPEQRRVTTGADPQKAPPYPGMYGAPSGSR